MSGREPAVDLSLFAPGLNAGLSTCPICGRSWRVTPLDDCLVPDCGCYGDETERGDRPCEPCGLAHIESCRSATERERTG